MVKTEEETEKGIINIEYLEDRANHPDPKLRAVLTKFELPPDPNIKLETPADDGGFRIFPGDKGKIWETRLKVENGNVGTKYISTIIFDSDHGKFMIQDRFSWGKKSRDKFRICTATIWKLIRNQSFKLFQNTLEKIFADPTGNVREHLVVRAGRALTFKKDIPLLNTQEDVVKRQPLDQEDSRLYQGFVKGPINWGDEENDIFEELCGASGANLSALGLNYGSEKLGKGLRGKRIFVNIVWISVDALIRFLEVVLPTGIDVILCCWEGIFNVYKKDVRLLNGEVIKAGTLINIYRHGSKNILSQETHKLIEKVFPVEIKPDLCGEAGEMIQDDLDIPTTVYNINEFATLGVPFHMEPWKTNVKIALKESPGALVHLKTQTPQIYNHLLSLGIIEERKQEIIPQKRTVSIDLL